MWPKNQKCAVAFTFDFDAESVWIAEDPENKNRPGVLSQGHYGAKVAVPLIMELLKKHDIRATFFVPGVTAETYPDRVTAIVAAGHEIACHGYTHTSPTDLSRKNEEKDLIRALEVLEDFVPRVTGYRSPSWDFSPNTLFLLKKHKFRYSSNMMDDIRPYKHHKTDIIELPVQWILDDAPHFWFDAETWNKKISTPNSVREIWEAEFEGIFKLGGSFILTMHPQIIGRPYRLKMLDAFIGFVKSHKDTWITTCNEIAKSQT
ncbi:MAG: polysaccharide deacetylase [Desulfobacterales bacterium]|nr:polysaccharide deacetylase [Desulfobacterales bacterium]